MVYKLKSLIYRAISEIGGRPQAVAIEDFLHANNCTFHHTTANDGKEENYFFKFQGGNFIARVNLRAVESNRLLITFPAIVSVRMKHLNHLRTLCNHYNLSTYLHKLVYNYDKREDEYTVDIVYALQDTSEESLFSSMEYCFTIQKSFTDDLKEFIDKRGSDTDPENENNGDSHEDWLARNLAMRKIEEPALNFKPGDEKALSLGTLLNAMHGNSRIPLSMTVTANGKAETVADADKIMKFDLSETLLSTDDETGETTWTTDSAVIVVTMADPVDNHKSVTTVTLTRSGQHQGGFYYEVTACVAREPVSQRHSVEATKLLPEPKCIGFTAARDTGNALKRNQEFDYMWKDAIDKTAADKTDELNDDQKVIARATDVDIAYCGYWGHKMMRAHRYLEAIQLLEPAFAKLKRQWGSLNERASSIYYNLSHLTGLCYALAGFNEKAYYYLSIASHAHVTGYTQVLVELLQRMNDPRAVSITDDVLTDMGVKAEVDEGDMFDDNASMKKFVDTLRWNRALTLFKLGYTNSAKNTFEVLLNSMQYHDRAIDKLAEIEQLKISNDSGEKSGNDNNP